MYFKSKEISLLILWVTAMVSSRTMLVSLDDPEGPNLLIVTVLASVIFVLVFPLYVSRRIASPTGILRILVAVALQVLIVVTLYFFLQTELPEHKENNSIEDVPVAVIENEKSDLIRVASPRTQVAVGNPITVSGEARGYWFFEGSFPLIVVDWDGKIIGEGHATAVGDWMTESFVPFTGTVMYTLPEDTPYTRGAIIFRKDNPSGLPEHDDALEIPISFE